MKAKYQSFNLVATIYSNFFAFGKSGLSFDVSASGINFDYTKTSGNLDMRVTTNQTRSENIYFEVSIFDYDTKKSYNVGYFYIKDNNGIIAAEHLKALYTIIDEGNQITADIWEEIA